MINFLFWNVGKRHSDIESLNKNISALITQENIDILAVCEYPFSAAKLLAMDPVRERQFEEAFTVVQRKDARIFYSKATTSCLSKVMFDQDSFVMNRFSSCGLEFNLACVHLPSKLYTDDATRSIAAGLIMADIRAKELETDRKTIVVGDFNADPHEGAVLSVNGFHALPDQRFAGSGRTVNGKAFDAFYNPMWNLYGDFVKPSGTYYYNKPSANNQLWYMFDQVIMRHDLIQNFDPNSLRIITEGLASKLYRPQVSDHFPIKFSLR